MTDVRLRLAVEEDLGFVSELGRDRTVALFLAPGAGDPDRLREFWLEQAAEEGPGGLYVVELVGHGLAGAMGLGVTSVRSRLCNLGRLMVDPALRRRGVGLASVRSACRLILVEHGYHRLQAETYGHNTAARRLFEAAGFTQEGIRRRAYRWEDGWDDGVLYGILAEEL
jgi:RimJ/RimL family protein N-acetyltransferase